MKAIQVKQWGGAEVLQMAEVADLKPGPNEVLVRMSAAGVNPVDAYIHTGNYPLKPKLPYTPGMDGAGTIAELGAEVKNLQTGARVYVGGSLSGTYAEFALCRADQVHPLPEHFSFEEGAGINVPYATAYRALFQKAQAQAGELVLIHGASGGVGLAAVQLARAANLRVLGTAGSQRGQELARQAGAEKVFDHTHPGYIAEILDFTKGKGVNLIIEMLANVNLQNDLTLLAQNGRVVVVGNRGKIEIDPRLTMGKETSIHGLSLLVAPPEDLAKIHAALAADLENRSLQPVVGQTFTLEQAPEAHRAVMQPGACGKIVLTI